MLDIKSNLSSGDPSIPQTVSLHDAYILVPQDICPSLRIHPWIRRCPLIGVPLHTGFTTCHKGVIFIFCSDIVDIVLPLRHGTPPGHIEDSDWYIPIIESATRLHLSGEVTQNHHKINEVRLCIQTGGGGGMYLNMFYHLLAQNILGSLTEVLCPALYLYLRGAYLYIHVQ